MSTEKSNGKNLPSWYGKAELEHNRKMSENFIKNFQDAIPKVNSKIDIVPITVIYGTGGEQFEEDKERGFMGLIDAVADYRKNYRNSPLVGDYPGPTKM